MKWPKRLQLRVFGMTTYLLCLALPVMYQEDDKGLHKTLARYTFPGWGDCILGVLSMVVAA